MKKIISLIVLSGILLSACSATKDNEEDSNIKNSTSEVTTHESQEGGTIRLKNISMSIKEIAAMFTQEFPEAKISKIESGQSFGKEMIEVTGIDEQNEYQVTINNETKKIDKTKNETLDKEEQQGVALSNEALDINQVMSFSELEQIIGQEFPQGEVQEWKLERELNTTYFEVELRVNRQEITLKVDAQTGDILEKEVD